MTQEEYEMFLMFQQQIPIKEKPVYVGSGEDFCMEMFNTHVEEQMENVE